MPSIIYISTSRCPNIRWLSTLTCQTNFLTSLDSTLLSVVNILFLRNAKFLLSVENTFLHANRQHFFFEKNSKGTMLVFIISSPIAGEIQPRTVGGSFWGGQGTQLDGRGILCLSIKIELWQMGRKLTCEMLLPFWCTVELNESWMERWWRKLIGGSSTCCSLPHTTPTRILWSKVHLML